MDISIKDLTEAVSRISGWEEMKAMARKVPELERRIAELERLVRGRDVSSVVCDHCGSGNLTRTGNAADPDFGELGVKLAVYRCEECGQTSRFKIS